MKRLIVCVALCLCLPVFAEDSSFYAGEKLFSTRASESKSLTNIKRFGPVGIGIDLIQPAFVMRISNVEEGSPAALSGKLKKGQIISSINGESLKDIDPRMQLAQLLGQAEATDGKLSLKIEGLDEPVVLQVPVLGTYSATWPMNCEKSNKIVRGLADYIASPDSVKGIGSIDMMFLMSTGDPKDMEVVGDWARAATNPSGYAWYLGFGGIPLCEYYLKTGDEQVLANIQKWADAAVGGLYLDGWAGRGGVPSVTYGNGHLNAAGTGALTFLLLAKECGAEIPDDALLGSLRHFYRYAGRGGNPYGDGRPEQGFVDNGKNGYLALTMAAAASLMPDGENSKYAKARDLCAYNSFYTTSFMLHGHTGGGIGEIWRSAAMGLMHDKTPKQYRDFMDSRQWHYELSRRYDGSFAILGGGGYDTEKWGVNYGLAYTVPRKNMRIFGAPRTKYSKPYELPKQLWGVEADNEFLSFDPVPMKDGTSIDLSNETLAKHSSMQFIRWFHDNDNPPTDDQIRESIHHRDHVFRLIAANKALGEHHGYIGWRAPGGKHRPHLVEEFLNHESPRVRRAMYSAIATTIRKDSRPELLTQKVFDRMIASLQNDEEAWWVKDAALHVVALAPADWLIPHLDLIKGYLDHEDWWLQNAAMQALTNVIADERTYKRVLPVIAEVIRTNQRSALTLGLMPQFRAKIKEAGPEVLAFAIAAFPEIYTGYTGKNQALGGQDISSTRESHLEYIAESLADIPGGLDVLYKIARQQYPDEILPYKEFFLRADPAQFGPELRSAITPIILNELVPEFVGRNQRQLGQLVALDKQTTRPGGSRDVIDQLAGLHERAGQDQYVWKMFADLRNAEWTYHTFDPIPSEQVPYDQVITRYREVTMPSGMEQWYATEFNANQAGWKIAKSPFGNFAGKIPAGPIMKCSEACDGRHGTKGCFAATPVNTLWDKEVLLMRGTFKLPKLKDGHRYRLRINDGDHVGPGGGNIVYINGKEFVEKEQCNGRGSTGQPNGGFVTQEFLDDFNGDEVTIAIKTFLRYNDKYKAKPTDDTEQGKISIHFEEQKLPPMGGDLIYTSAKFIPMMSMDWQTKQDRSNPDIDPEADKYRWDGTHKVNPLLHGQWQVIGEVPKLEDFNPEKLRQARRPKYTSLDFKADGKTDNPMYVWTGDTLLDLKGYQALKMRVKSIAGGEYLFIESGGFSNRNKPDWTSPLLILQRK
ncbi:MAG: DUF6288 domain-containing protein [Phycisphaeraceae bacterium]